MNIPIYNDYGDAIGKWLDYGASRFDIKLVAGATMPVNRWALLEEYFRWFQAGLIDDIAMLGETDVRNKDKIFNFFKRINTTLELNSFLFFIASNVAINNFIRI